MIALTVLLACMSVAVFAASGMLCWLVLGRAVQTMRYDLDAAQQALKMSAVIDQRVADRVQALVDRGLTGIKKTTTTGRSYGEQPPDPNVQVRGFVDDIHEIERETQRIRGDHEYTARDGFTLNGQPLPEETIET